MPIDIEKIRQLLSERILILDGAMGTMIQAAGLGPADYAGTRFASHDVPLKGDNDILCLTRPEVVRSIHDAYLDAGADILETNTFNANRFSQGDFGLSHLASELCREGARIARAAADAATKANPSRPRLVAGVIGPTGKTLSISPSVEDPSRRDVAFDEMEEACHESAAALLEGGADLILLETVFDTLNCKAAIHAVARLGDELGFEIPLMISGTIADSSGRILSGQTAEAFLISVSHAPGLLSVGFNCALGPEGLRPHVKLLAEQSPFHVSAHPNAGLPDAFGRYLQTPAEMAAHAREWGERGFLNIMGGCCGTTPAHIKAIAEALDGLPPRRLPQIPPLLRLSGLEPLVFGPGVNFINVGERTNVAGSKKFLTLVKDGNFSEALGVAREQIEGGASIIDINMDDAMLDSAAAMARFADMAACDPDVAKVPFMVDSSRWEVVLAALKRVQGKPVVNSISLKEGEAEFVAKARQARRLGAAVLVMAFDEAGQADTLERRVAVCGRSFQILVDKAGVPPQDIIFDPNVFAVGTGIEEHDRYALDFIEAVRRIKSAMPLCHVSGGISNVSFSFRGNNPMREAIHAVFLYHAIKAGLDMGIVNPAQITVYDDIPKEILESVESALLCRCDKPSDLLLEVAQRVVGSVAVEKSEAEWRRLGVEERLSHALVSGIDTHVEEDAREAYELLGSALKVVEGPLMRGMDAVGDLFGQGKMFLPQVVKSARVMKKAVSVLAPHLDRDSVSGSSCAGKVLLATVKGDVHDIGKNIVGIVLKCNNYEVLDLGVMVSCERILEEAARFNADVLGLSGLITPSLDEMANVASEMERLGLRIPLVVGGATTSKIHTAARIAPRYSGPVEHVRDASKAPGAVSGLLGAGAAERVKAIQAEQEALRAARSVVPHPILSLAEARANALRIDFGFFPARRPAFLGVRVFEDYPLAEIAARIDWAPFFWAWEIKGPFPALLSDPKKGVEARKLHEEAKTLLGRIISEKLLTAKAVFGIFPANSVGDDIAVFDKSGGGEVARLRTLRQQGPKEPGLPNLALSDFVAPADFGFDHVGAFAVTAGIGVEELADKFKAEDDDYSAILVKLLADRLAEAFAELLHRRVRTEFWGYAPEERLSTEDLLAVKYQGIRPAPGYPSQPDHTEKRVLFDLLGVESSIGVTLTESYAMSPAASVCGLYFHRPESKYFSVGRIGADQVEDYAARKNIPSVVAAKWLDGNLGRGGEPTRWV